MGGLIVSCLYLLVESELVALEFVPAKRVVLVCDDVRVLCARGALSV